MRGGAYDWSYYADILWEYFGFDFYAYYNGNMLGMALELPYYDFPATSFGACIAHYCGGAWVNGYYFGHIGFYTNSYDANNPTVPSSFNEYYQTDFGMEYAGTNSYGASGYYLKYLYSGGASWAYLFEATSDWSTSEDVDVVAFSSASVDGTNAVTTVTFTFGSDGESAPLIAATALGCGLLVATLV